MVKYTIVVCFLAIVAPMGVHGQPRCSCPTELTPEPISNPQISTLCAPCVSTFCSTVPATLTCGSPTWIQINWPATMGAVRPETCSMGGDASKCSVADADDFDKVKFDVSGLTKGEKFCYDVDGYYTSDSLAGSRLQIHANGVGTCNSPAGIKVPTTPQDCNPRSGNIAGNFAGGQSFTQPEPLELGTQITALADIVITAVRIFGATTATSPTTIGIWNEAGAKIRSFSATIQEGWNDYELSDALALESGGKITASYSALSNTAYWAQNFVFSNGPISSVQGSANKGVFNQQATGLFPDESFNDSYYYVDIAYVYACL